MPKERPIEKPEKPEGRPGGLTAPPPTSQAIEYGRQAAVLDLRMTCTASPIQFEGRVGTHVIYFRARFDTWMFGRGSNLEDAVQDARSRGYRGRIDSTSFPECFQKLGECIEREFDL